MLWNLRRRETTTKGTKVARRSSAAFIRAEKLYRKVREEMLAKNAKQIGPR
jgi:hypothetical protein